MSEEKSANKILEAIRSIESKIDNLRNELASIKVEIDQRFDTLKEVTDREVESIKKEAFIGGEDQLFFAVIISFLVLFITLPINDLVGFLETALKLNPTDALSTVGNIRYLGIAIFLFSSLTRYYAFLNDSKTYRFISFEALWFGLNIIISIIIVNTIPVLTSQIGPFGISFPVLVATIIFIGITFIEKAILEKYAFRGCIPKEYVIPLATQLSLAYIFGLCMAIIEEVVTMTLGNAYSSSRFYLTYMIFMLLLALLAIVLFKKRSTKLKVHSSTS